VSMAFLSYWFCVRDVDIRHPEKSLP